MLNAKYAFISAYLKGEEAKVVTPDHIDRLSKTSSLEDALTTIRETDIGDYLEGVPIKTFYDLDEYLWGYLAEHTSHIEAFKFLPDDILKVSRAYLMKYDISNVKAALHGILTGKKPNMIPLGVIHNCELLDELSGAENISDIIELLTQCQLGDYASVLNEYKMDEGVKSSLLAEAKLDSQYYKKLLNMTKGVKDGFVLFKAFGLIIDLTNLQIISRAIIEDVGVEVTEYIIDSGYMLSAQVIRELLSLKLNDVPSKLGNTLYRDVAEEVSTIYNRTQSITSVEEIIDKYKLSLVKEILSPRVLSPPVVAWHLILKELEIRNLRLILRAMFDNIPVDEIRQYLVLSS